MEGSVAVAKLNVPDVPRKRPQSPKPSDQALQRVGHTVIGDTHGERGRRLRLDVSQFRVCPESVSTLSAQTGEPRARNVMTATRHLFIGGTPVNRVRSRSRGNHPLAMRHGHTLPRSFQCRSNNRSGRTYCWFSYMFSIFHKRHSEFSFSGSGSSANRGKGSWSRSDSPGKRAANRSASAD